MKTLWLKIAASVVLVLAVIIVVKVFWFTETEPVTEPKSTEQIEQIQEKDSSDLEVQPKAQQPEEKQAKDIEQKQPSSEPEELSRTASFPKRYGSSSTINDEIEDYRQQMLKEYSSKPKVKKSRTLRRRHRLPKRYHRQHNVPEEEISPSN